MADGTRRVQALGANLNAVHDGVAPKQPERPFQIIQALFGRLVARVSEESPGLQ